MPTKTEMSAFNSRTDSLLQGVPAADISSDDRDLAIRQAVKQYNLDLPRREMVQFAGDDGNYYLLYGKHIATNEANQDAGVALKIRATGDDQNLGIRFTTTYMFDLYQVNLLMSRIGSTCAGSFIGYLYSLDGNDLPDVQGRASIYIDIDDDDKGPPVGYYRWVEIPFDKPIERLPAGSYAFVIEGDVNYEYSAGVRELLIGVDQANATASNRTFLTNTDAGWIEYGTDSIGMIELVVAIPNWEPAASRLIEVECPAADPTADETPQPLEAEDFDTYESQNGHWLRLPNMSPTTGQDIRIKFARPYMWSGASDPIIDTPEAHFEAICNLAASYSCEWLATRYEQNIDATIVADVADHQDAGRNYRAQAKVFNKRYLELAGLDAKSRKPGIVGRDMDLRRAVGASEFLFHKRSER
jgi:hypothetical protein